MGKATDYINDQVSTICQQYIEEEIDHTTMEALLSRFIPDRFELNKMIEELKITKQAAFIQANLDQLNDLSESMKKNMVKVCLEIAHRACKQESSIAFILNAAMHAMAAAPEEMLTELSEGADMEGLLNVFLMTSIHNLHKKGYDVRRTTESILIDLENERGTNDQLH